MPTKQNGIFNAVRQDFLIKCRGMAKHEKEKFLENVDIVTTRFERKVAEEESRSGTSTCVTLWVLREK